MMRKKDFLLSALALALVSIDTPIDYSFNNKRGENDGISNRKPREPILNAGCKWYIKKNDIIMESADYHPGAIQAINIKSAKRKLGVKTKEDNQ